MYQKVNKKVPFTISGNLSTLPESPATPYFSASKFNVNIDFCDFSVLVLTELTEVERFFALTTVILVVKYTYANSCYFGRARATIWTMKMRGRWERWVDDTKLACVGVGMVLKKPKYVIIGVLAVLLFAYILTLFKDGTSTWGLLWSNISFGDKIQLKFEVWGRVLGNLSSLWGLVLMLLALLQGLTVMLLVFGWRARVRSKHTAAGLEAGGVGTAISFLALGCPTCGTSLLVPILTTALGSGAAVMAETLGWVLATAAVVLLLHAARRLGYGAFVEITARRHKNGKV